MASELERAKWAATWCRHAASLQLPYRYGAGHGVAAVKPWGIPPTGNPPALDCSAVVSAALWYAGKLGQQFARDTRELERLGLPGPGAHLTWWVRNSGGIEHTALELQGVGEPHPFFIGRHTGTLIGWQPSFDSTGYTPRRMNL